MDTPKHEKILLQFDEESNFADCEIRSELSTVARTGSNLWLAFDEGLGLERLTINDKGYGNHTRFIISDYIHLPGGDDEIDIEGIAYSDHYIWIVGSHSLKRDKPKKRKSISKQVKSLRKVKNDPNRYTIARIPVVLDKKTGQYELFKECPHPDDSKKTLTAAKVKAGKKHSKLSKALRKDKHIGPFMHLPGKDNGLDIEGIAVHKDRIMLGLRGPVLRGYAIIIEIAVKEKKSGKLKLKKIGKHGNKYRKHFVHLRGMGIRELAYANDDLLILAGPTMDCDGTIALYRMKKGPKNDKESLMYEEDIDQLFNIALGHETPYGRDKAEGVALTEDQNIMIVYDAPADERMVGDSDAYADVFEYK